MYLFQMSNLQRSSFCRDSDQKNVWGNFWNCQRISEMFVVAVTTVPNAGFSLDGCGERAIFK
jgi:hypothetical protein